MSDEQIAGFLEVAGGCDRKTAEAFLKGNNYDFEKAVMQYFEDPDPKRYKDVLGWNEEAFSSGRDGPQSQMEALPPAYQMDDDGRQSRSLVPWVAPSRPPSRNKSRISLRSSKDVEMTPYGPYQQGEEPDEDMKKALQLSMEDQQTGIIDATGVEYVPDPEAAERQRGPGEPAFLKPLPGNNLLPPLITILHSIPQCREAMLSRHETSHEYGDNQHWWEGETIETARIVAVGQDVNEINQTDLITETQRLMAFLSGTDRSYGSALPLSRLSALQSNYAGTMKDAHPLIRFMVAWEAASDRSGTDYRFDLMFRSVINADIQQDRNHVYLLDIRSSDLQTTSHSSLYDVLDRRFWQASSGNKLMPDSFLSEVGPVVVIRIPPRNNSTSNSAVSIPMILYADRYLDVNEEFVKEMHSTMEVGDTVIGGLATKLGKLEVYQDESTGKIESISKVMDAAIGYARDQASNGNDESMDGAGHQETSPQNDVVALNASQVLARLQAINEQLQVRVNVLREEKEKAEASLQKLSKLFTDPNAADGPVPSYPYYLRGVGIATSNQSHTIYAKHESSMAHSVDAEGPSAVWWRMSYDTAGDKALVSKEQVGEQAVTVAAGELLSETLLVYACNEMLRLPDDDSLPSALQEFVATDNAAFRQELEDATNAPTVIEGRPIEVDGQQDAEVAASGQNLDTPAILITDEYSAPVTDMNWQSEPSSQQQQSQAGTIDPNLISTSYSGAAKRRNTGQPEDIRGGFKIRGGDDEAYDMDGADSDTATLGGSEPANDSDEEMSGVFMRGRGGVD